MIILPNVIFAVNPLPPSFPLVVNIKNIWFSKDVTEDGAEINRSSLSLPPSYNFK